MTCPVCKDGRLTYLRHESQIVPCYDYYQLVTKVYLECDQCSTVRRQEHVTTIGSTAVYKTELERLRDAAN